MIELSEFMEIQKKYNTLKKLKPENYLLKYFVSEKKGDFSVNRNPSVLNEMLNLLGKDFPHLDEKMKKAGYIVPVFGYDNECADFVLRNYKSMLEKEIMKFDKEVLKDWGLEE